MILIKPLPPQARHTIAAEQAEAVRLASYEALANVVEHAYPVIRSAWSASMRCAGWTA